MSWNECALLPTVLQTFAAANMSIHEHSPVRVLDDLDSSRFEARAQVDLTVQTSVGTLIENQDYAEGLKEPISVANGSLIILDS